LYVAREGYRGKAKYDKVKISRERGQEWVTQWKAYPEKELKKGKKLIRIVTGGVKSGASSFFQGKDVCYTAAESKGECTTKTKGRDVWA